MNFASEEPKRKQRRLVVNTNPGNERSADHCHWIRISQLFCGLHSTGQFTGQIIAVQQWTEFSAVSDTQINMAPAQSSLYLTIPGNSSGLSSKGPASQLERYQ